MRVIDQMLAGQISVPEARAQMAWIKAGGSQAPRVALAAVKSAAPVTGYEMYDAHPDPQIREWAAAAAEQAMVTKGMLPGGGPPGPAAGEVRALVRGRGPDGSFGWRQVRAAAPSGPPVMPPGMAGR